MKNRRFIRELISGKRLHFEKSILHSIIYNFYHPHFDLGIAIANRDLRFAICDIASTL
jgi:hypothetical protein